MSSSKGCVWKPGWVVRGVVTGTEPSLTSLTDSAALGTKSQPPWTRLAVLECTLQWPAAGRGGANMGWSVESERTTSHARQSRPWRPQGLTCVCKQRCIFAPSWGLGAPLRSLCFHTAGCQSNLAGGYRTRAGHSKHPTDGPQKKVLSGQTLGSKETGGVLAYGNPDIQTCWDISNDTR